MYNVGQRVNVYEDTYVGVTGTIKNVRKDGLYDVQVDEQFVEGLSKDEAFIDCDRFDGLVWCSNEELSPCTEV